MKATFNEATAKALIGKTIIDVQSNYIKLDNGLCIYLEDSEIEILNDGWSDESLAENQFFKSHPELNP